MSSGLRGNDLKKVLKINALGLGNIGRKRIILRMSVMTCIHILPEYPCQPYNGIAYSTTDILFEMPAASVCHIIL